MKIYFDTGLLLKLYYDEPNSIEAEALVGSYGQPILFCGLQQTELWNALYRKCARKEVTLRQLKEILKDIQDDLDHEILQRPEIEWPAVWIRADRLTAKFALSTQCRTLDVLHVAAALQLGLKEFGTTDARQTALARLAGLKVVSPR